MRWLFERSTRAIKLSPGSFIENLGTLYAFALVMFILAASPFCMVMMFIGISNLLGFHGR